MDNREGKRRRIVIDDEEDDEEQIPQDVEEEGVRNERIDDDDLGSNPGKRHFNKLDDGPASLFFPTNMHR